MMQRIHLVSDTKERGLVILEMHQYLVFMPLKYLILLKEDVFVIGIQRMETNCII